MISLTLPWPPSGNHYVRHTSRGRYLTAHAKAYYTEVALLVRVAKVRTLLGRLRVTIAAHPPDRRKRDLSNLLKCTEDAMQKAGVYADDSQIDHLTITRADVRKGGAVRVTIEEIEA